jgi:ubiquinone/menaquinone biosynthesis C-methylase UbiE
MLPPRRRAEKPAKKRAASPKVGTRGNVLNRLIENDLIRRVSYSDYRRKVQDVYDGPQGAALVAFSLLSLHVPLMDRLLRTRRFDLRGARNLLDVGSGAGQIAGHLLKYADPDARIVCTDLSPQMLRRARQRLKSPWPRYAVADLCRLPFADRSFDCITCGYVLEHVPDAQLGLRELARVLAPGGRMLLVTSEDNFAGACTSRVWRTRTYNRQDLRRTCRELGLEWKNELWFTRMHRVLKAGGICVEIEKAGA